MIGGKMLEKSNVSIAGYYCGFIPWHMAWTNWMNSMKKAEKLEWSDDLEWDFKELKVEFLTKKIQEGWLCDKTNIIFTKPDGREI